MEGNLWIYIGIGVVAILALIYWWMRPVDWSDGEGTSNVNNPLDDTNAGSFRWWFTNSTDTGKLLSNGLNLRDWWENERRRWRR